MSMIRHMIVVLAGVLMLWGWISEAVQRPAGKPQSPVAVSISAAQTPEPGQPVDFVVTVSVKVTAVNMRIRVQAPGDMVLHSGKLFWQGTLDRDQTKSLHFTGSFTQRPNQQIMATAVIKSAVGARFASRAFYEVFPAAQKSLSEKNAAKSIRRDGRGVVEYPLPGK